MVVLHGSGQAHLAVDRHKRVWHSLFGSQGQQIRELGLVLLIGQVYVFHFDLRTVPQLQIEVRDVRGLRRRPRSPSAARTAGLQESVSKNSNANGFCAFAIQCCLLATACTIRPQATDACAPWHRPLLPPRCRARDRKRWQSSIRSQAASRPGSGRASASHGQLAP